MYVVVSAWGMVFLRCARSSGFLAVGYNSRSDFRLLRFLSTASAAKPHFMVDYLTSTMGLSASKAAELLPNFLSLKSVSKPDSVFSFLQSYGFSTDQVRLLLSLDARLFRCKVSSTLEPKFMALRCLGFSNSEIAVLSISNPSILSFNLERKFIPRISCWLSILGSKEALMKSMRGVRILLSFRTDDVNSNIALLQNLGIPCRRIASALHSRPHVFALKHNKFIQLIDRVGKYGVPQHSSKFLWAMCTLNCLSDLNMAQKKATMMKLGWTEVQFIAAFRVMPSVMGISVKLLQEKVEFFTAKGLCSMEDLADTPALLGFSLEKRVIPRFHVMQMLKSKGLTRKNHHFCTVVQLSEKTFVKRFITEYQDELPELLKIYSHPCRQEGSMAPDSVK